MIRGDWFLDIFTAEAEKLIERLKTKTQIELNIPLDWWVKGLPEPASKDQVVAAVDGGGGLQPLAGGGAIYVARAFGYVGDGEPERLLELRVYPVRDSRILDALRAWLEHRIALRLLERLNTKDVLLLDGSYRATVSAALTSIVKASSGHVHSLGLLYTAHLSLHLLITISEFTRLTLKKGVFVAYVSKDHSYRALKEKILLELIAFRDARLTHIIRDALSWYPLADREQLVGFRRLVSEQLRLVYDAALDPSYRDVAFISDSIGQLVGHSWPLRLPPNKGLHQALTRLGGIRGVVERLCSKFEEYLGEEEAIECWGNLDRAVTAIDQLSAPRLMYVKLHSNDLPLLVELLAPPGSFLSPGRVLEEPSTDVEYIVSVLLRDYAGPEYYNIPLIAAHMNASLTGTQLTAYMKLLENLAAAHGVKISFARRFTLSRRAAGVHSRRGSKYYASFS